MLSRSKPPTPIWRLRSKQVLNVIDEKLLAFSLAEAQEFFAFHGVSQADVAAALAESFGHAGGLKTIARSLAKPAAA
jgi:ATP/maltotriose-dependent transcriptional regulator MalT